MGGGAAEPPSAAAQRHPAPLPARASALAFLATIALESAAADQLGQSTTHEPFDN